MKKITRIFLFILSAHGMCAQNLVLNPGFEINRSSAWVTPLEYNRTDSWHQPSNGTSDIFSVGDLEQGPQADYIKDFDVYGGEAHPHSGTNFGGEIIYSQLEDQTEYREYMTGQLSQPLTIGTTYTVSFWMQLGKGSKYSISSIQIYLSAEDPGEWSTMHHLNFPPQLDLDLAEVNEQKGEWVKVSATFRSRANEKYFVIGNFRGDLLTKGTKTKDKIKHGHNYTYCYFDDFYVGIGDETNSSAIDSTKLISDVGRISDDTLASSEGTDSLHIAAGKKLVLENIYFENDKAVILEGSYDILDEIISEMQKQPELKVEIDGHTDSNGTPKHNETLSLARANAVAEYFEANGIDKSRITTRGFGSSRPVVEEHTDDDRAKNRRVEFIFTSIGN